MRTIARLMVFVVAAVVGLLGITPADAAGFGVTVAGGNDYGPAANQLATPVGVALDSNGNLYVADADNHRVQRWAPGATSAVTVAGGNGIGAAANQLVRPWGVAFDSSGNLYVVDSGNHRVQRWAPGATSGVTVAGGNGQGSRSNQFNFPGDVVVDSGGNLYVADLDNFRVQRWAPGATSGVTVAGTDSAANLVTPFGVALDSNGNLYVADADNHRVQRWAPGATSGVTVAGGNGIGTAANQLVSPNGMVLDSTGNLYVADTNNHRVQRWAPGATSGVTVAGGNGQGSDPNQFNHPVRVALDVNGNLYVSDFFNSRVQRWAPDYRIVPGQASAVEGDIASSTAQVPVTLLSPSNETVTVQWTTLQVLGDRPDQADPNTDYTAASGTVTFNPGETTNSVSITVDGDTLVEPDEYIVVSFHHPTNATLGGFWGLGIGVITNDDHAAATPGLGSTIEGDAGTATLAVPITLSNPSTQTVTVQWTTVQAPGARPTQADPTTDYTPVSGTVTFNPGEMAKTVTLTVNGDTLVEPNEYIVVSFHDPTNAVLGGFWGLGLGVITNND